MPRGVRSSWFRRYAEKFSGLDVALAAADPKNDRARTTATMSSALRPITLLRNIDCPFASVSVGFRSDPQRAGSSVARRPLLDEREARSFASRGFPRFALVGTAYRSFIGARGTALKAGLANNAL